MELIILLFHNLYFHVVTLTVLHTVCVPSRAMITGPTGLNCVKPHTNRSLKEIVVLD